MDGKGNFLLDFVDVRGNRPNDRVDVFLKHTVLGNAPVFRDKSTSKRLKITDLDGTQGGTYSVLVFPMRHRPVSKFIQVLQDKTAQNTFVLPIDPARVISVNFPSFASLGADIKNVLENSVVEGNEDKRGAELYQAMDEIRKAGLLNIYAKMKATRFENGRDVFSYVLSLTRVRGSRFFAKVKKDLRDEVKNSIFTRLFHEVSGALHTPPPNFKSADSFKSLDLYGNLQLTFFSNPQTLDFIIDADIDDAQGIGHFFQVVGHFFSQQDSHPYDIREILLGFQKIDPGYDIIA